MVVVAHALIAVGKRPVMSACGLKPHLLNFINRLLGAARDRRAIARTVKFRTKFTDIGIKIDRNRSRQKKRCKGHF